MIGIATLTKLAKGTFGPDEISALFEGMGMQVEMGEVDRSARGGFREAFTAAGQAAALPRAKLLRISGTDKEGNQIEALIVLAPPGKRLEAKPKIVLDAAREIAVVSR